MDELCRKASEAVKAGFDILILSDRGVGRDAGADSEPAGHRRRAPSPGARGHAHAVRAGRRVGRRARSAPRLAAARLRRRRGEPVRGVRDDRRHDPAGHAHRHRARQGDRALHQGAQQGRAEGDVEDGDLDAAELLRRADLRGDRAAARRSSTATSRTPRRASAASASTCIAEEVRLRHERAFGRQPVRPQELEPGGEYQWRRDGEYHLFNPETVFKLQHATRSGQYSIFKEYTQRRGRPEPAPRHAARPVPLQAGRAGGADRRGGAGRGDRQAVRHRRDVLRLDQPGGARDAGDRDEPPRRPVQHRRGRRGCRALPADGQRRLEAQRDQAGGLGPLRRDQRIPGQRRRAADQDGAGRQAGRGRPAARAQGLPVDREDAALDAGRRPDLAAAAPRHLFDRGPGAADLRPEELEPRGAHLGEAGGRGRRRHGGGRRGQGALRRRADLGPRRRHRRLAADQPQARRPAVGAGPGRDAAGAGAEQAARPHRGAGGRPDEDRPRRRDRRAARRRGIRLRHRAAGGDGLHHDARLPPEHLPGGHRDAGSGAAQEVHRLARVRRRTSSGSSPRKCAS